MVTECICYSFAEMVVNVHAFEIYSATFNVAVRHDLLHIPWEGARKKLQAGRLISFL